MRSIPDSIAQGWSIELHRIQISFWKAAEGRRGIRWLLTARPES
jgi:hypothetical protein